MTEEIERPPQFKAFAAQKSDLWGASTRDAYDKHWEYRQADDLLNLCMTYSNNYNDTMLDKLEEEQPDFFSSNNINRNELQETLNNNMCVSFSKLKALSYRKTTAAIVDKKHLTDHIRKLYNGGDRFHPYF